jgi:hypothetical protein
MTPAEKNLLLVLANQRVTELKMAVVMIDQELQNPQLPQQQKAFLFMQRGQVATAAEETEKAFVAVQQEGKLVIGK